MSGPWEDYAPQPQQGPWSTFGAQAPQQPAPGDPAPAQLREGVYKWANGQIADFPDPDAPKGMPEAPKSGFQWSPMSIPALASGMAAGVKDMASIPHDLASGQIDLNNPAQAGSTAGRLGNAALGATGISPASAGTRLIAPSLEDLYKAGDAGFDAARGSGVEFAPGSVAKLAAALRDKLVNDEGILPQSAPRTHAILDSLANPPPGAVSSPIGYLDSARKLFGKVGQSPDSVERMAAGLSKGGLLDFMQNAAPADIVAGAAAYPSAKQQLADAIGNWAAAKRSDTLQGIDENAELRASAANSGKNVGNATRQRVASLIQNPPSSPGSPSIAVRSGFDPDEISALSGVVKGSPLANTARNASNYLGGGGGLGRLVASGAGAGLGLLASHATGMSPEAGMAAGGAAAYELGSVLKGVENRAVQRGLRSIDETVRQRSPLFQSGSGPQTAAFPRAKNILLQALAAQQAGQQQP